MQVSVLQKANVIVVLYGYMPALRPMQTMG